jgi:hypothetical protein
MRPFERFRSFGTALVSASVLASCSIAPAALAEPIQLTIDPNQSSITLAFDILGLFLPQDTAVVSGTIDADLQITEAGGVSSFESLASDMAFSDMFMSSEGLPGNVLEITSENTFVTFAGGPVPGTAGPTVYDFDVGGFAFDLDEGTLTIETTGLIIGNSLEVTDLAVEPLLFTLTAPTVMELTASDLGGGIYDIEVLIPIDEVGTILASESGLPADVDYSLMGPIVATGTLVVPEPAFLLQLACGLGLLGVLRRSRG